MPPNPWKNRLPWKLVPGSKRLGTTALSIQTLGAPFIIPRLHVSLQVISMLCGGRTKDEAER